MMQMLQSLVAERLGVALHRETRELPAYVLRLGKGKPALEFVDVRGRVVPARGGMTFQGMTLPVHGRVSGHAFPRSIGRSSIGQGCRDASRSP